MCMFCAAVPAVTAMGAAASGEQRQKIKTAQASGVTPPHARPYGKFTVLAILSLLIISALYHTQQPG